MIRSGWDFSFVGRFLFLLGLEGRSKDPILLSSPVAVAEASQFVGNGLLGMVSEA